MEESKKLAQWIVDNKDKKGTPEFETVSAAFRKLNAGASVPQQKSGDYDTGLQATRAGLQGLTFGLSDEVGAAIWAAAGSLSTGESFSDAYSKIHNSLDEKRDAFREDNPVLSTGLEIAGGALTGGVGGAKVLGGKAMQQASNLGKAGRIGGVGATEGAIYGAGSADQGERLEGAITGGALGGVLAPVGAGLVNSAGKVGGAITNYAADKLTKTPTTQAQQILRDTAEAVGLSGDEIATRLKELGAEGTITDVDDAFRGIARAGMNQQGTMRKQGKNLAFARQKNQQKRLLESIEEVSGKSSEYNTTLKGIIQRRSETAGPIYDEAFQTGVQPTQRLKTFANDPLTRGAFNRGAKWAKSEGDESLLNQLHYAKMAIDDDIGKAMRTGETNKARILLKKKKELLGEIESQNPKYIEAMQVFSDESALKNALELGRDIFKKDPEEIEEIIQSMTQGEQELFRLGGVKAVANTFDTIGQTRNALGRIMDQPGTQKQLALVLGDDAGAFLKRAGIEEEFAQTRAALNYNSTTAKQLSDAESLKESIDPGVVQAVISANPGAIVSKIAQTITKGDVTPEIINSLGEMMFRQGMSKRDVLRIFQSAPIRRAFGDEYDEIVAPYVRGSISPVALALAE